MSTPTTQSPSEPLEYNTRWETVPLTKIVPYWRNPRNTEAAVDKVALSIEKFGYQQPIVVDEDYTIIVGHTRYAALKRLGWTEAPILVTDLDAKRAKEYRLVDNRTSEYGTWDQSALRLELQEITPDVLTAFFPHIDLNRDFGDLTTPPVTDLHVEKAETKVREQFHERNPDATIDLTCPHCYETVSIKAGDLAGKLKHG